MDDSIVFPCAYRGGGYGLKTLNSVLGLGLESLPTKGVALPIGKGRIIRKAKAGARRKIAILSIGTRLVNSCQVRIHFRC